MDAYTPIETVRSDARPLLLFSASCGGQYLDSSFVKCAFDIVTGAARDCRGTGVPANEEVSHAWQKIELDDVGRIAPRATGKRKVNLRVQPRIFGCVDARAVIYIGSVLWNYLPCTFGALPEKSTSQAFIPYAARTPSIRAGNETRRKKNLDLWPINRGVGCRLRREGVPKRVSAWDYHDGSSTAVGQVLYQRLHHHRGSNPNARVEDPGKTAASCANTATPAEPWRWYPREEEQGCATWGYLR